MQPFFSVIICTYNRARLLRRALDSLISQSETDWEALVVDDGSTDNTAKQLQQVAATEPRIRILRNCHNSGLSAARNSGVQHARGQFVTFLDSDDEYKPDHLATRRTILERDASIRFLYGGVTIVGDPYVIDNDDHSRKIHIDDCVLGGTFFFRRDVFYEINGFENVTYGEDTLFFERASDAGVKMSRTNYPSYIYYRNVPGQLSSGVGG